MRHVCSMRCSRISIGPPEPLWLCCYCSQRPCNSALPQEQSTAMQKNISLVYRARGDVNASYS